LEWYAQDDGTAFESLLGHQKYRHGQIQGYLKSPFLGDNEQT
jgi:hypothetical protein